MHTPNLVYYIGPTLIVSIVDLVIIYHSKLPCFLQVRIGLTYMALFSK